jgi:hypothetical protein
MFSVRGYFVPLSMDKTIASNLSQDLANQVLLTAVASGQWLDLKILASESLNLTEYEKDLAINNGITAIKAYRQRTSATLKDAAKLVLEYRQSQGFSGYYDK